MQYLHSCWVLRKNQFKKIQQMYMVPRATWTLGWGTIKGHVYRHVGRTSYVNQNIFNSEMKNSDSDI